MLIRKGTLVCEHQNPYAMVKFVFTSGLLQAFEESFLCDTSPLLISHIGRYFFMYSTPSISESKGFLIARL